MWQEKAQKATPVSEEHAVRKLGHWVIRGRLEDMPAITPGKARERWGEMSAGVENGDKSQNKVAPHDLMSVGVPQRRLSMASGL